MAVKLNAENNKKTKDSVRIREKRLINGEVNQKYWIKKKGGAKKSL